LGGTEKENGTTNIKRGVEKGGFGGGGGKKNLLGGQRKEFAPARQQNQIRSKGDRRKIWKKRK